MKCEVFALASSHLQDGFELFGGQVLASRGQLFTEIILSYKTRVLGVPSIAVPKLITKSHSKM